MDDKQNLIRDLADRAIQDLDKCSSFAVHIPIDRRDEDYFSHEKNSFNRDVAREISRVYALGQTVEGTVRNFPETGEDDEPVELEPEDMEAGEYIDPYLVPGTPQYRSLSKLLKKTDLIFNDDEFTIVEKDHAIASTRLTLVELMQSASKALVGDDEDKRLLKEMLRDLRSRYFEGEFG